MDKTPIYNSTTRQDILRNTRERLKTVVGKYQVARESVEKLRHLVEYSQELICALDMDTVWMNFFNLFRMNSGIVFGAAYVRNSDGVLESKGRFGFPKPDKIEFTEALAKPIIADVLEKKEIIYFDATDCLEQFDESIRRYMVGVNVLAVPMKVRIGIYGVAILYRKGEQPFMDDDIAMAEHVAKPTALAIVRCNK